jgi:hypothetical protein
MNLDSSSEAAILSAIESLKLVYTIVLTLSMGEAFRQFVNDDKTVNGDGNIIHWDRLIALIAFLFLIIPFTHGMNRYFFSVYVTIKCRPQPYSFYLLLDTVAFTIEAGLFFVMSRSLPKARWHRFFTQAAILLGFDILWGSFVSWSHTPEISGWVLVNACSIPLLLGLLWWRRSSVDWLGPSLGLTIIVVRTVFDYFVARGLYFPR